MKKHKINLRLWGHLQTQVSIHYHTVFTTTNDDYGKFVGHN
jgi:hypothetical protein